MADKTSSAATTDRGRIGSLGEHDAPHSEAQLANTHLEHLCLLDMFTHPHTLRNTGIICTIGKVYYCTAVALYNTLTDFTFYYSPTLLG